MKIEDIKVGDNLVIGARFFYLNLYGIIAEVKEVIYSDMVKDNRFPNGMIKMKLPNGIRWILTEVWLGPEYLTPVPGSRI